MKRVIVFLACILLIACEDDEYSYSGKYASENFYYSKVKVFTSDGEITDPNTIEKTVFSYFPGEFVLNSDTVLEAEGIFNIEFLEGDKAFVNYRFIHEQRSVKEKNGVIYVESEDLYRYYNSDYETISDKINKYNPLYSNTITIPSSSGYSAFTEFKHCVYLLGNKNTIKVPFLTYVMVRNPSGDNFQVGGEFKNNNSFNKRALEYLVDGDTLIVQEYYINLIKQ